ncbi:hypothetical protein BZM26_29575 [Paraburkholderia strydomiana]|nr:hypothetical protein BZM26_29575 [Paraburkholderia strydomiana]
MWFGWSGKIRDAAPESNNETSVKLQTVGNIQPAALDLNQQEYDSYYLGYANDVLWPVFYYRLDLAKFD